MSEVSWLQEAAEKIVWARDNMIDSGGPQRFVDQLDRLRLEVEDLAVAVGRHQATTQ